ncbi:MAG: two component transcriptional regulator, LuxR family [Candidatus Angelobacter sp.]|nr:two component transcriptional regulator, LuxR family [Candidatus Angelobacter sp.]
MKNLSGTPNNQSGAPERVRILVSDATLLGCELLASALRKDDHIQVVGCATKLNDLLSLNAATAPDVAVISMNLEGGALQGLDASRELRKTSTRAVLILDRLERELVIEAFRNGAKGVFFRNDSFLALRKAIRSVHLGQVWAGTREVECLIEALAATAQPRIKNAMGEVLLNRREEEIVWLVAEGLPNREISVRLNLSEHTVKNYLFHVFDKLGISSRSELIIYLLHRRGMKNGNEKSAA